MIIPATERLASVQFKWQSPGPHHLNPLQLGQVRLQQSTMGSTEGYSPGAANLHTPTDLRPTQQSLMQYCT